MTLRATVTGCLALVWPLAFLLYCGTDTFVSPGPGISDAASDGDDASTASDGGGADGSDAGVEPPGSDASFPCDAACFQQVDCFDMGTGVCNAYQCCVPSCSSAGSCDLDASLPNRRCCLGYVCRPDTASGAACQQCLPAGASCEINGRRMSSVCCTGACSPTAKTCF